MKMKSLLLAAALFLPFALGAQEAQNAALAFTRIESNPRMAAFAGAGLASQEADAWSAISGAARLSFLKEKGDAALGFQLWKPAVAVDKSINFGGGAALRFGNLGVALAGTYDRSTVPYDGYCPNDLQLSLGLSYFLADAVSLGLNARYASQHFSNDARVNGFSVDISALYVILPELTLAATVGNVGPKVKGSGASFGQPSYARLGVAWNKVFAQKHGVEFLLDGEYNFGNTAAGALGVAYNYNRLVFVRAGYRLAGEKALIPSHLGLGIGLQYAGFRADVSLLTASKMLGNTLNIGLGYSF